MPVSASFNILIFSKISISEPSPSYKPAFVSSKSSAHQSANCIFEYSEATPLLNKPNVISAPAICRQKLKSNEHNSNFKYSAMPLGFSKQNRVRMSFEFPTNPEFPIRNELQNLYIAYTDRCCSISFENEIYPKVRYCDKLKLVKYSGETVWFSFHKRILDQNISIKILQS